MVALDLDHAVLEGAARTTAPLEFGCEIDQLAGIDRDARDRRDDLSATTPGRSTHTNDAVSCLRRRRLIARLDSRSRSLASAIASSLDTPA